MISEEVVGMLPGDVQKRTSPERVMGKDHGKPDNISPDKSNRACAFLGLCSPIVGSPVHLAEGCFNPVSANSATMLKEISTLTPRSTDLLFGFCPMGTLCIETIPSGTQPETLRH